MKNSTTFLRRRRPPTPSYAPRTWNFVFDTGSSNWKRQPLPERYVAYVQCSPEYMVIGITLKPSTRASIVVMAESSKKVCAKAGRPSRAARGRCERRGCEGL